MLDVGRRGGAAGGAGAGPARRDLARHLARRLVEPQALEDRWRTWPSGVHSRNATSATSSGLTQRSPPALRRDQRPGVTASASSGGVVDLERASRACSVARRCVAFQPVPTLPA